MQDVTHQHEVGLRQVFDQKIAADSLNVPGKPGGLDLAAGKRRNLGQIEGNAFDLRMPSRDGDRERATGTTNIAGRAKPGKIEPVCQDNEIVQLYAGHGLYKCFEPLRVGVKCCEQLVSSSPCASLCGRPVCKTSVRCPQDGYNRWLAIARMLPI